MEQGVGGQEVGGVAGLDEECVGGPSGIGGRVEGASGEGGGEGVGVGDDLRLRPMGGFGRRSTVAQDEEEEAERGEVVPRTEVRAEEARGGVRRQREAEEEELRVRLERGPAAEGGEEGEVEEASRSGGRDGFAGSVEPPQAARRRRRGCRR